MKKYPLVSIITPSLNSLPYLEENIRSVREQDYPNVEHIIIDGSSDDGTIDIIKGYPHLVWISETDNGQSQAINKGFKLSSGEIIGWLNSDDQYTDGAISIAVNFLRLNPEIDLIYSDVIVIDENDKMLRLAKGEHFKFDKLLESNIVKQPTIFFRRAILEVLGGVREDLHFVMDWEFWLRASFYFKFEYIPDQVLAKFRYCKGTKSQEKPSNFHLEWIKVLSNLYEKYKNEKHKRNSIIAARRVAQRSYNFSLMKPYIEDNQMMRALSFFVKGICCDIKSLFSFKVWKLLFRILFNREKSH